MMKQCTDCNNLFHSAPLHPHGIIHFPDLASHWIYSSHLLAVSVACLGDLTRKSASLGGIENGCVIIVAIFSLLINEKENCLSCLVVLLWRGICLVIWAYCYLCYIPVYFPSLVCRIGMKDLHSILLFVVWRISWWNFWSSFYINMMNLAGLQCLLIPSIPTLTPPTYVSIAMELIKLVTSSYLRYLWYSSFFCISQRNNSLSLSLSISALIRSNRWT